MNHCYRSIWNASTGAFAAVSENARGSGKKSSAGPAGKALVLALALAAGGPAGALPVNGVVTAGAAGIDAAHGSMTIEQTSQNAALEWHSFSIGQGEAVRFVQPNSAAVALNRVLGADPSTILGSLSANGKVFLVNPNGVLFGAGASVNVGALVASTLDLGNADFMAGRYTFAGNSGAAVVNAGSIHADGGYVALLGARVSNQGLISARLGTVAMAAGQGVTLDVAGDGLINVTIDRGAAAALADNGGMIAADGGYVLLSARSAGSLLPTVVNNTGIIHARSIDQRNGVIKLLGDMQDGTVNVAGTLDAGAPTQGEGGFIDTSAHHVAVADGAIVSTAAANGNAGTWLIDPVDFTIAAGGGALTASSMGATTLSSSLASGNVQIITGSTTAGNGDIFINSPVNWAANKLILSAHRNIVVNANLNASATASLSLRYGQSAVAVGNTSGLITNGAVINLPAGTANLTIRQGSNGALKAYTVMTSLGAAGSTTTTDLQGMNGNLALNYALGANIDASATAGWNAGAGFMPVSTNGSPYTGNFDGLGHTISNLAINRPATDWAGLFGRAGAGSELRNVGLVNARIGAGAVVGALAGMNNGTIKNSYMNGAVVGTSFLGGLVGSNDGNVSNSYSTGLVSGADQVGGLVGGHNAGTIDNSFATGNVTGTGGATGGLVGYSSGAISNSHASGAVAGASGVGGLLAAMNGGTVSNSYATGPVTGVDVVGGLIGNSTNGTLNNVYATGAVTGANNVGGLIGSTANASVNTSYATGLVTATGTAGGLIGSRSGGVTNGYWNSTVNGATPGIGAGVTTGATGLSSVQMQTAANYAGFGFTTTPGAAGNSWVMIDVDGSFNNFAGTLGATRPMLASEYATTINNAHQLQLVSMAPAASYKLGRTIDAAATAASTDVWSAATFLPIAPAQFTGQFDGQGYTINKLRINRPGALNVGLFSYLGTAAVVSNLGLVDGSVMGSDRVGALAGRSQGSIINSYASTPVSATGFAIGGLVGMQQGGSVLNSYATGAVSGNSTVGGLYGYNANSTTSNSYATGAVSGGNSVGGLSGYDEYSTISNSYATGAVSATGSYAGGLIGDHYSSNLSQTYATGAVSGAIAGGLIGVYEDAGTIVNSYWNSDANAAGIALGSAAGHAPLSLAQMKVPSNFAGFVFTTAAGAAGNSWVTVGNDGTLNSALGGGTLPMLASEYATSIANGHQLQLISMNLAGSYTQTQNIDLGAALASPGGTWGATNGFVPIGGVFSGSYDGQSRSIGGLMINRPALVYQGLFGSTSAASTIRNVALVGGSVTGSTHVGSLVGRLGGTVSNSYASVNVTATNYAGGLIGYAEFDSIISNSYATGTVSAARAGGLVGRNDGIMVNSYASGAVSGTASGGLIGQDNGGLIISSFWNMDSSGKLVSDGGTGLSNAAMMQLASFGSWNGAAANTIADVYSPGAAWRLYEGHSAPMLASFMGPLALAPDTIYTYDGTVRSGAAIALPGGVSGAPASGTGAGTYNNSYYAGQDGPNLLGARLIIDKATLALTGTRAYDGSSAMAGSVLTGTGVAGQTFTITGAGDSSNLSSWDVQTGSTLSSVAGLAMGTSANGGLAANYALGTAGSAVSITPASVTIGSSDVIKTYDGNLTAAGAALVTSGTLFGADSLSGGTFVFTNPNAGSGNKVVGVTGVTVDDGNGGGNYNVLYADNTTSTINRALLTASASASAGPKVYDGNTGAAVALAITGGLVAGESLGVTGSASYNSKDVLSANLITVDSVVLADGTGLASNYNLAAGQTTAGAILAKALTASASASPKTYDGNTSAAATLAITGGLVAGESVGATGSATFNSKDVLSANLVTVNSVLLSDGLGLASNYSLAAGQSVAAAITPKALTATGSVSGKTYDGNTSAAAALAIAGGLVGAETLGVTGSAAYNSKDVLSANLVTFNSVALLDGTGLASNYSLAPGLSMAASIFAKALMASVSASGKTYDGNTNAAATLSITGGLVAGEVVGATGVASFNSKDVLAASLVTVTSTTLADGTGLASNYSLAAGQSVGAAIAAKALTVGGMTAVDRVYNGGTAAALSGGALHGMVGSETLGWSGQSGAFADKNVGALKPVTVSGIALVNGSGLASNYSVGNPTGLTASITRLGSVAWTGGASGNWFDPANWACGALPDLANVAAVILPAGVNATFGNGGAVSVDNVGGAGGLTMVDGALNVAGDITLASLAQSGGAVTSGGDVALGSFSQSGGTLAAAGSLSASGAFSQGSAGTVSAGGAIDIIQASGSAVLGNLAAGSTLDVLALTGSISQAPGTRISSAGIGTLAAPQGSVVLADSGNAIGGAGVDAGAAVRLQGALGSATALAGLAALNGNPDGAADQPSRPFASGGLGGRALAGLHVVVVGQGVRMPAGVQGDSTDDDAQ